MLFCDLAEVGDVVFGGHGDGSLPSLVECWVAVEDGCVLCVDVEEVELSLAICELRLDDAEELAKQGGFERVEEGGDRRRDGKAQGKDILLEEADGGEELPFRVISLQNGVDILLRNVGESGVEFYTEDFMEGGLGCNEHGASLACADVKKGVALDGEGRRGAIEPDVDDGAEDGWRDAVVGGDVLIAGVSC